MEKEIKDERTKKRYIAHINEGYLQGLYLQEGADTQEKKEALHKDIVKRIRDFVNNDGDGSPLFAYDYQTVSGETVSSWWLEDLDRPAWLGNYRHPVPRTIPADISERKSDKTNIKEALDAMYYHTKKGNVAYYWMIASVLGIYALTHVGIVAVTLAMVALILGLAQNMWQGITLEIFCRKLDTEGKKEFDDYPSHISNGGWIIYCVKMAVAVASVVTFVIESAQSV